jgi:hypothetical protein
MEILLESSLDLLSVVIHLVLDVLARPHPPFFVGQLVAFRVGEDFHPIVVEGIWFG